jgi:hypothetical protein
MGQVDDGIHLVETVEDVARLQVADPESWPMSRKRRYRSTIPLTLLLH